ncbi:hypothetical protein HYPSUDRAFT_210201 [Hypholoma sublateritium FD-334 SS-4]|uniref:Uncharacterized protein n=1 Tax=Hypholoma sublateritium (strain FD-334 SS-4) TaxID=945553 RepID=A0A0D2N7I5_HYPSF|nr:hypothetical protein HYPSUDRAFT_210201 [Hypholoma sublateritium FD-334 SS-4]
MAQIRAAQHLDHRRDFNQLQMCPIDLCAPFCAADPLYGPYRVEIAVLEAPAEHHSGCAVDAPFLTVAAMTPPCARGEDVPAPVDRRADGARLPFPALPTARYPMMPVAPTVDIASSFIWTVVVGTTNDATENGATIETKTDDPGPWRKLRRSAVRSRNVHDSGMAIRSKTFNRVFLIGQVAHLYFFPALRLPLLSPQFHADTTQWDVNHDDVPQRHVPAISGSSFICIPFGYVHSAPTNLRGPDSNIQEFPSTSPSLFIRRWESGAITKAYRAEYSTSQDEPSVCYSLVHDRSVSPNMIDS